MIDTGDIRKGSTIDLDGRLVKVIDFSHNKQGRGSAQLRMTLRDLRTGATWGAPDSAARAAFADAGLSEYLIHGLGHAVGYNVHEQPMMALGALETFAGGEVMTVEPGLYIPGWGGVRIEDVGVVEAAGLRVITHAPKASFL